MTAINAITNMKTFQVHLNLLSTAEGCGRRPRALVLSSSLGSTLYLKKLKSLSIGEHIATAFANMLRHALTYEVLIRVASIKL